MPDAAPTSNFLRQLIADDLRCGRVQQLVTRFPPEPNGYLHIGHAKSICLNFGLARDFGGRCHLRFDDTNPAAESGDYVEAIKRDIRWLGYDWDGPVRHASDSFEQLYEWALHLIDGGHAFVCELGPEQMREHRGTLETPGTDSPWRDRQPDENRRLFAAMRAGDMEPGAATLRARISMGHPNMNMRDPVLWRIIRAAHHRTGDAWCIYPSYDFAHGQQDAIEGISHSLCTLEFADHRPLYDWLVEHLPLPCRPRQHEFARLNLSHTITSKRLLRQLVEQGRVSGWDDPRMPTLAGMRRRGYPAAAIRQFCDDISVSRADSLVDMAMLEHAVRQHLDADCERVLCVMEPLRLVLTNWADGMPEQVQAPGRTLPFGPELCIERGDWRASANKKYKRLAPGRRVRLRHSFVIEADDAQYDAHGNPVCVRARLVEGSLGCDPADGKKPKGVIHWVCARQHCQVQARIYERLLATPECGADLEQSLNRQSLGECQALGEAALAQVAPGQSVQFERVGYFCRDPQDAGGLPVFNRVVALRDSAARRQADEEKPGQ